MIIFKFDKKGGFGIVYKAMLRDMTVTNKVEAEVAVKEMIRADIYDDPDDQENREVKKIYEFQHEMLIMRYEKLLIIIITMNRFN